MSDVQVLPLAEALLACLCEAASGNPNPPEHCCFRVGEVAFDADMFTDLCCEGLAYVTLGGIYPSSDSFPEFDSVRQANAICAPASWAVELSMGILRCAPTGGTNTMPSCDDWNDAFTQNAHDAQALRAAACCFRSTAGTLLGMRGLSVVIGEQTQISPEGGCMGRTANMVVQIVNCDCSSVE